MIVLAALLLAASAARAENRPRPDAPAGGVIRRVVGPVRLRGVQPPMVGPVGEDEFAFPGPGWIKGYDVRIRDGRGAAADERGIICHSVFREFVQGHLLMPREIDGIRRMGLNLTVTEGANEVRLPEGFGVAVDTSTAYRFQGVLQSSSGANDGDYTFDVDYDYQPLSESPALKTLTVLRVGLRWGGRAFGTGQWEVPPGHHSYSSEFGTQGDVVVHMIDFHLHRYVTKVELLDAGTGRALYAVDVKTGRDGYPIGPRYSSVDGFPLRAGRRYAFRITYDNPTSRSDTTMALMQLYVSG
jgi:hypothetical protein